MIEPKKNSNVPSLDWGKQNEINAAEAFMKQEGIHHRNPKPLPSGLVISKSHPYIGGTPDNIFVCSCCDKVYVEYKYTYSIRDYEVASPWNKTTLENVDGVILLKRTHSYYDQVIGQMALGHLLLKVRTVSFHDFKVKCRMQWIFG